MYPCDVLLIVIAIIREYSSGLRGIGCAMMNGLFVLFNMFYLQPKLANSIKQMDNETQVGAEDNNDSLACGDVTTLVLQKSKMNQAKKMILILLITVMTAMTASRLLYGIASLLDSQACFVMLFIGKGLIRIFKQLLLFSFNIIQTLFICATSIENTLKFYFFIDAFLP